MSGLWPNADSTVLPGARVDDVIDKQFHCLGMSGDHRRGTPETEF